MLTNLEIKRRKYQEPETGARLPNRLSDAKGLYVCITPPSERYPEGIKSFRWDFRFNGRRCVIVFGQWPTLTLEKARELHLDAKRMVASGNLPAVLNGKIVSKSEKLKATSIGDSRFKTVGEEWYAAEQEAAPKSDSWKENFRRWLDLVYQDLGEKTLQEIEAADVLAILRRIAAAGTPATAEYIRQTISRVFNHGILNLRAPRGFNPAESCRGAIKVPKKKHHPKLKPEEIPAFIAAIRESQEPEAVKLGLQILLHTFPRRTELTATPWSEIKEDVWSIPGARMKKGRDHVIPITPQVQAMFSRLRELAGDSPWVFPSPMNPRKHRSINTLNYAVHRLGYKDRFTPHSARATAVSILADSGYPRDVVKLQLAHGHDNDTDAAYFQNQHIPQRRAMLEFWSSTLDGLAKGADVVPIGAGRAA
jgi:integrase